MSQAIVFATPFSFHAPVPRATTKDNYDFTALLRRAAGTDFAVGIERVGFWDLRAAIDRDFLQAGSIRRMGR